MSGSIVRAAAVVAAALALAPAAHAGGPSLVIGATDDSVRASTAAQAKAQMDLISLAGFTAVRITDIWTPGQTAPSAADLEQVGWVTSAAQLDGVTVYATILNVDAKTAPLTDEDQADFAAYSAAFVRAEPTIRHVIVGSEPNLNLYWLPQFDADGGDAAATAYESLLAQTYDAIKAVAPEVEVIGGAVSPRGNDDPHGLRLTHSPTTFIPDLGAAYRASGRTTPIMDAFAFHPYEDNSSLPPATTLHPNSTTVSIGDYGKLIALLGQAFDGTAQRGSTLPIVYDEFGVQSQIPPEKASLYTGTEQTALTRPVDEATQALYYRQAVQLSFCEPTVEGFFVFHAVDETDLGRWQSGLFYPDDTPKTSLAPTQQAFADARRGVIARCAAVTLTPKATAREVAAGVRVSCDIDCTYVAQLYRLPGHLLSTRRGRVVGGTPALLPVRAPHGPGRYRLRLTLRAPVNPGRSTLVLVPLRPR
jgi:hypothetical protein